MSISTTTTTYRVSLGNPAPAFADLAGPGAGWGEYQAESPESALARAFADWSLHPADVALLSESATFGQGAPRINGNGAQDRSAWWYVSTADRFVGVYERRDAR